MTWKRLVKYPQCFHNRYGKWHRAVETTGLHLPIEAQVTELLCCNNVAGSKGPCKIREMHD